MDAHITPEMKVLDAGCGDGKHLEYLAKKINKSNLFGTEISQIRVDRVREKGFHCEKVDGVRLPFEDSSFDVICFFEVIEHIPENDVMILMSEFLRVLKPRGIVIGSTPNYPIKRFYDVVRKTKDRISMILHLRQRFIAASDGHSDNQWHQKKQQQKRSRFGWFKYQMQRLVADMIPHTNFFAVLVLLAITESLSLERRLCIQHLVIISARYLKTTFFHFLAIKSLSYSKHNLCVNSK
jgi:SAM-dependent methyltransferase